MAYRVEKANRHSAGLAAPAAASPFMVSAQDAADGRVCCFSGQSRV